MWESFVINSVLAIIKGVVKNSARAAKLKSVLLEIRDAINNIYS